MPRNPSRLIDDGFAPELLEGAVFPDSVLARSEFVRYDDWTTLKKKGGA